MKLKLKRGILLALLSWDGMPMIQSSLVSAAQCNTRPAQPTDADVLDALKDLQAEGYVIGATDDFSKEQCWTLTVKGTLQARQLR